MRGNRIGEDDNWRNALKFGPPKAWILRQKHVFEGFPPVCNSNSSQIPKQGGVEFGRDFYSSNNTLTGLSVEFGRE